jgi:hypothetical protein
MSSSTDLNLTGVREEIAVAVAEAMRKQQAMFQCQNAGVIAKQVSEQVAAALKTALLDLQKPTFDLREQILGTCLLDLAVLQSSLTILANVNFILDHYKGFVPYTKPVAIVVASYGSYLVASAYPSNVSQHDSAVILEGPAATSDVDALQGLYNVSKRALVRALDLDASLAGFTEIDDLRDAGTHDHSSN